MNHQVGDPKHLRPWLQGYSEQLPPQSYQQPGRPPEAWTETVPVGPGQRYELWPGFLTGQNGETSHFRHHYQPL